MKMYSKEWWDAYKGYKKVNKTINMYDDTLEDVEMVKALEELYEKIEESQVCTDVDKDPPPTYQCPDPEDQYTPVCTWTRWEPEELLVEWDYKCPQK